jgi:type VI secretion system protein VasJ
MSTALDDQITQFVDALEAPIADDTPTGTDVTYDDDFRDLKDTVDALSGAAQDVDLKGLADKSLDLLTTKSKDLRVAGYFVVGQTRVNGMTGMAASLAGLRALLEAHWAALYPPERRAAARKHALQFVADHLGPWIKRHTFTLEDQAAVTAALEHGQAIQELAMEQLGEHAPALSGFLNELDRAARRLEQRAKEQAPPEPAANEDTADASQEPDAGDAPAAPQAPESAPRAGDGAPRPTPPPPSTANGSLPEVGEELKTGDALRIVTQVAAALRSSDDANPAPYRLLRTMRWSALQALPPNTDGKTQIPAPEAEQRAALEQMLDRGAHQQLLGAAEQTFQAGSFHLWLDLQYLAFKAASGLGGAYGAVADAIRHETTALLRRVPGLPSLTYRDGTPFAGPAVQGWLDTLRSAGSSSAPSADADDPLADVLQKAQTALNEQSLDEALALLRAADADDSDRTRFRRRLYSAMICLDGGEPQVARALLEALDDEIAAHDLERWEPALAQTVWERLYVAYTRLHSAEGPDLAAPAGETYRKLCRLDPTAALSLPPLN